MNSEQNPLPTLETIAAILGEMRRETNERFDRMEQRLDGMEQHYDQKFEDIRLQMMSFDVRIDRLEAIGHECLNVAFNARADVKVFREEVRAWATEVANLSKLPV